MNSSVLWRVAVFVGALVILAVVFLLSGGDEVAPVTDEALVCQDDAVALVSPLFQRTVDDIALYGMDRRPVMLHELAGTYFTVVIFCSYRCPCSDGYVDRLDTLRQIYEPRGVRFAAIHSNADETMDGMTQYIQRKNYPLPVYRDDLTAAADMMEATVTPEVFVFDTLWALQYHGRIDDDKSGFFVEDRSLSNALDTLLSGRLLAVREKLSLGCAIVRNSHDSEGLKE
ncbi:MAG: hypothetical protein C0600_08145 [Ignavibacteria bacterium]|nr:MAG: hypothetical protein C0600_08145 [Ignavibacteria bacterium]